MSRKTKEARPAKGPIPHKSIPRGPLKNGSKYSLTNPAPQQALTGQARGQSFKLPSLVEDKPENP